MEHHILYQTTNNLNGKTYVGIHSTDNLEDGYLGSGKLFLRALDKYGAENFTREILEFHDSRESLSEAEKRIVNLDWVQNNTNYNLVLGGGVGVYGYTHSDEVKRVMSEKRKGRKITAKQKAQISKAHKGKITSDATKKRLREINQGEGCKKAKLTAEEVIKIRTLHQTGTCSVAQLARLYNVHYSTIRKIIKRERWNHI